MWGWRRPKCEEEEEISDAMLVIMINQLQMEFQVIRILITPLQHWVVIIVEVNDL